MKCSNCAANLQTSADGRSAVCPYCGADQVQSIDPAAIAAGLRSDFATTEALFGHLCGKLARELPDHVQVEVASGFFSSGGPVAVKITFGPNVLALRKQGSAFVATRTKTVRGIQLKNETLALDAWVDALAQGLAALGDQSAAGRDALKRLR